AVDREVEAAGALQARDVPVVDDLDLDLGHEEDDHPAEPGLRGPVVGKPVRLRCVVAVRPERADYPVGVDDAAGEAPAAADQVTALYRVPGAARGELPGDDRAGAAGPVAEDPARAVLGQPAAGQPVAPGADHRGPRRGGVDVGEFLDHVAELDRRQRRPAQLGRGLQPEHAERAQGAYRVVGERAQLLGAVAGGLELLPAGADPGDELVVLFGHDPVSSAVPSGRSTGITSVANNSALRFTCSCVDGPIANSPMICPNPPSSS